MPVRNTQSGVEAGLQGGAAARLTQSGIEAAVSATTAAAARLTQSGVEVLVDNPVGGSSSTCAVASGTLAYRLRIRNEADDADELVITSLAAATNPYLVEPPDGDGQTIDPLTGHSDVGEYTGQVIDAITTGTDRVVTEVLTDAGGYQLLSRRAYWEASDDDGGSWDVLIAGYLKRLTLEDALVWDFAIGDARRDETTRKLFERGEDPFDRVSNMIGTPVRGGFAELQDFGGWRFRVATADPDWVDLIFVEGWMYDDRNRDATGFRRKFLDATGAVGIFQRRQGSIGSFEGFLNEMAKPYGLIDDPNNVDFLPGKFYDLEARVEATDGTLLGFFTPFIRAGQSIATFLDRGLMLGDRLTLDWTTSQPSAGTDLIIWVYPKAISDKNPVHVTGHPVDLVADALGLAGVTVDAGQQALTKSTVGDDAFVSLRITAPMTVEALKERLGGFYGFTTRAGSDGETEFIPTRSVLSLPATVIGAACLRGEGEPFELEESTIVNRLTVEQTQFDLWIPEDQGERPIDMIAAIPDTRNYDNGEVGTRGDHPLELSIPGRIETRRTSQLDSQSGTPIEGAEFDTWVRALGDDLFQRFGRGADVGMLELLRGERAQVGDLLLIDLDYVPNGNVRGGQKIVQVTQATPRPEGIDAKVMAIAVNLQPATVPTFTIVVSATDPRHVADLTLTNPGSLPAGSFVRVEWAIGSSITGGTLLTMLDVTAGATTVSTPRTDNGTVVSARMRSEVQGQLPGPWTGWQSVTLTAIAPVTNLVATPIDAQSYELTWDNAETDVPIEILLKLASEPAFTINPRFPFQILPAGSDRFTITQLTTGVAYTAGVRYRDLPLASGSTIVTVALNPSGTAPTLNPPTGPVAWAGRLSSGGVRTIDGTFGMDVTAVEFPSDVEFDVASETAVGSGTAGSFAKAATIASVQGGVTRFSAVAANDGKLRYMRARHTRSGSTASAYTTTVSINPWSSSSPGTPSDAEVLTRAAAAAFPNARVVVNGDVEADFATPGQVTLAVSADGRTVTIMAQFGDGVAAPNVGARAGVRLPFNLDVIDWMVWADASGSAVVDVRRTTYAALSFASIAASAKPTLSAVIKNQDTTLTGWTTALDADDLLDFLVESVATCKLVMVALKCRRRIA